VFQKKGGKAATTFVKPFPLHQPVRLVTTFPFQLLGAIRFNKGSFLKNDKKMKIKKHCLAINLEKSALNLIMFV